MSGSPEQEQEEDRRGEGKGSGRDDDEDPANGFEDNPDSQQVGDAQQTIESIDETRVVDDSDTHSAEQIVETHLDEIEVDAVEDWAEEDVLDKYEDHATTTVERIKDTAVAREVFDNIGEIFVNQSRTGLNYSSGKDGVIDYATFEMQATRRESTYHHEFGHGIADAYGYGISTDAAREGDIRYDDDEDDFVEVDLERDDIEEFKLTQLEGTDAPEEIQNLVDGVNKTWEDTQRTVQNGGDPSDVVVHDNYGSINAHETLAQMHEVMQTDRLPIRGHANFFHEHPELTKSYVEAIEPADRMKDLITHLHRTSDDSPFDTDPYPDREV